MSMEIDGKICHIFSKGHSGPVLFWGIGTGEQESLKRMLKLLEQISDKKNWMLVAYESRDWNRDFSPWPSSGVWGKGCFSGGGEETMRWLLSSCIPYVQLHYNAGNYLSERLLGGYSLSGLFSLWAFYSSGQFGGVASCSGSLWYPNWEAFVKGKRIPKDSLVYLSLGKKEEQTKNQAMARVGDITRRQYEICRTSNPVGCVLEWNHGGHFQDPEARMAKGFGWLLNQLEEKV